MRVLERLHTRFEPAQARIEEIAATLTRARVAAQSRRIAAKAGSRAARSPGVDCAVPVDATAATRLGYLVIALFFGGLGSWAALAPVAGAAIAPGVVKVDGNRQTLQSVDGGAVTEIAVKDGERVAAGQVLIRLDDTAARAKLDSLVAARDAAQAQRGRLVGERDGADGPVFDRDLLARRGESSVADALASQTALFAARKKQFETAQAVLQQKVEQLMQVIIGTRLQVVGDNRELALTGEELQGTRELYAKGYAPKTKILALERTQAQLTSDRGAKLANIAQAEQAIGEARLQMVQAEHARLSEVTQQLRDAQTKLAEIEPQIASQRQAVARTRLRAPVSGDVVGSSVFTVGGVVTPAAHLLDIVPSAGDLVVEAKLRPQDIDEVAAGAAAQVRLSGAVGRNHRALAGTVETVSADRLESTRTGEPYYAAQIRLDAASVEAAGVTLQAGMPAEVLIATRPRSVLEYLIAPLSDQIARAFREP